MRIKRDPLCSETRLTFLPFHITLPSAWPIWWRSNALQADGVFQPLRATSLLKAPPGLSWDSSTYPWEPLWLSDVKRPPYCLAKYLPTDSRQVLACSTTLDNIWVTLSESLPHYLADGWLWAKCLTSLSLSLLICKMGQIHNCPLLTGIL